MFRNFYSILYTMFDKKCRMVISTYYYNERNIHRLTLYVIELYCPLQLV